MDKWRVVYPLISDMISLKIPVALCLHLQRASGGEAKPAPGGSVARLFGRFGNRWHHQKYGMFIHISIGEPLG